MKLEKRVALLQNMAIVTLALVSLFYLNKLFGNQIDTLLKAINSILLPLGIALFISYLLAPIVKILETRFKIKQRWLNVVIVFVILIVVAFLFVFFIGTIVYEQAGEFLNTDWNAILVWVQEVVAGNSILQDAYLQVEQYITFEDSAPVIFDVLNVFKGIVNVVVTIVLVPVFLVFLLHDKERVFKGIVSIIPEKNRVHVNELGIRANDVIEKYFNGRFITMFIMSVMFTILFLVFGFGFDKAIFFGFTLGFLDIIPYIGGFIGILLPVLYSFTISDTVLFGEFAFIGLIIANVIGQGIQGNILQPYIMGKEVNLHPLLILSSFIFFGALFGITGIILAIPITGTIKTSFEYYGGLKNG